MKSRRVEIFKSRRDRWAHFMVWGVAALCLIVGIRILLIAPQDPEAQLAALGALLGGMGAPWFMLTTHYTLSHDTLTLRSGPFFKRIKYTDIVSIQDGRGRWGVSFAFSTTCLQLDVRNSKLGYRISPEHPRRFLHAMHRRCGHLLYDGKSLLPKP